MDSIQTTGGILHPNDIEFINNCICEVFNCEPSQITELQPLQKGLSNSVLSFKFNGGKTEVDNVDDLLRAREIQQESTI